MNKKGLTKFWAVIVVILLWALALVLLFFMCKSLIKESQPVYNIKQNVCHTEKTVDLLGVDKFYNLTFTNKTNISFDLGGLETKDFYSIINYIDNTTDKKPFSQIYDYSSIYAYVFMEVTERQLPMAFIAEHLGYVNEHYYSSVEISGNGIRIEGDNVKNLRYDMNKIFVSYIQIDARVNIKNITVCADQDTEVINLLGVEMDKFDLNTALLSQACSCTDKKVICGMFENNKITKCANGNQMIDCCCSYTTCRYDVQFECLKYSCEGNYTVEVVKK